VDSALEKAARRSEARGMGELRGVGWERAWGMEGAYGSKAVWRGQERADGAGESERTTVVWEAASGLLDALFQAFLFKKSRMANHVSLRLYFSR
jgi:hypothetical protein